MIIKSPPRTYALGETPPPIGEQVRSWPWGGTPNLTAWSLAQLKYPLGTVIYDVVDGYPVIAQIQTHPSYGAHPDWPDKPHKGTSVFVPVTTDENGHAVAMKVAPAGWGQPAAEDTSGVAVSGDPPTGGFKRPKHDIAIPLGGMLGFMLGGPIGAVIGTVVGAIIGE